MQIKEMMSFSGNFAHAPEVVHFDHMLRRESVRDAKFVEKLGRSYGVPVRVYKIDVSTYAKENKFSLEEAARILRYRKLSEHTAAKGGKGIIFTAHNATDQLETVVMRLVKGAGRRGFSGIRKFMDLPSGWKVVRPLIEASSDDIMEYMKTRKLKFRTDKSNYNVNIPRNFIRHRMLGLLKKINPSIERGISKQVDIWAQEDEYLDTLVRKAVEGISIEKNGANYYIELEKIISYNGWLQRRILKKLVPVELDYDKTDALVKFLYKNGASSAIDLGGGYRARKDYSRLILEKEAPRLRQFSYEVLPGSEVFISEIGRTVRASLLEGRVEPDGSKSSEVFDADALDLTGLRVKSRENGEKMSLFGMSGTKKIKDLCIDLKLPLEERNRIAVFTEKQRVLWVAPHRRSDTAPVTESTKRVLKLEVY
jgi:tRNA(Ile)-lysidine synthase